MFDLEAAIDAWCRQVHPAGRAAELRIAELADHLHCEVERRLEEGLDAEHAFHEATVALGDPAALRAEHARAQRTPGAVAWALCTLNARRLGALLSPPERAALQIGLSLVVAAAMMVTSALLDDADRAQTATHLWIAAWWIPFTVIAAAQSPQDGSSRRCGSRETT